MGWLWIIVTLLSGLMIGYLLARRTCKNGLEQAAVATARVTTVVATAPTVEDPPPPVAMNELTPEIGLVQVEPDDLRRIEGIGPKIADLMQEGGILTFAQMAEAPVEDLQEILDDAGEHCRFHNPASWPMQAGLASEAKWDELQELQNRLDGGKLI